MNAEPMVVVPMAAAHAAAVGELHARYMPDSELSRLGGAFVGHLYAAFLRASFGVGFSLVRGHEVVGFSFGRHPRCASLAATALESFPRLAVQTLKLACTSPRRLSSFVARLSEGGHVRTGPGVAELLSIVVRDDARNGPASRELGLALFRKLQAEGCHTIRWETLEKNQRAQAYYKKIQGRVIGESVVSGEKTIWYERPLDLDGSAA